MKLHVATIELIQFLMLRFSDKNQKAIDLLRTKCLKLKSMVLCDGKLYEIMRGNFERADRRLVIECLNEKSNKIL